MENPYMVQQPEAGGLTRSNFFSRELELPRTIPPGLKMSQKGSFEGTDS